MAEPDVEAHPPPGRRAAPGAPGFDLLRLVDEDELGSRYVLREQSTGLVRTVRIVDVPLTAGQKDELGRLWEGAALRPVHPFLALVVAHGTTDDGAPWVATDDEADESLGARLASGRPLGPPEVASIALGAAQALAALHALGLVHGGIGPAAIVREGGNWRLTDTGIAAIALPVPAPTSTSTVGSTLAHAAPEVLAGEPVAPAADVYALGGTLSEALTGRPVVHWAPGDSIGELLGRHATDDAEIADDAGPATIVGAIRAACRSGPGLRPTAATLEELLTGPVGTPVGPAHQVTDDDVQFTVYRPEAIRPAHWCTMVAFAHKTDEPEPEFGRADPVEEVRRQARAVLGDDFESYVTAVEDSSAVLVRGTEITFVPHMDGVEFNPPQSSFRWVEAVQREEFRLRADPSLDGKRARGRLSVFVGTLLVADVNLTIRVDSSQPAVPPPEELSSEHARPYRRIFASYSHRDGAIVEQIAMLQESLGDEFIRDCTHLRSGEVWNDRLMELIDEADVFQLFWSTNSIGSRFVRQEWEYALSLGRRSFVRPCYWEEPLPARPEQDLPPETLQRLHFQRLLFGSGSAGAVAPPPSAAEGAVLSQPPTGPIATPGSPPATSASASSWSPPGGHVPTGMGSPPTPPVPSATPPSPPPVAPSAPGPPPTPPSPPPGPPPMPRSFPAPTPSSAHRRMPALLGGVTSIIVVLAAVFVGRAILRDQTSDVATTATTTTGARPTTVVSTNPTRTTNGGIAFPTTTVVGTVTSIVATVSDVPAICVRGGRPDTARVSAAVEGARGLVSLEVISVLEGKTSTSKMAQVPAGTPVDGLKTGPGIAAFTATIGPFDAAGTLTWTIEGVTRAGETLQLKGGGIQVRSCAK